MLKIQPEGQAYNQKCYTRMGRLGEGEKHLLSGWERKKRLGKMAVLKTLIRGKGRDKRLTTCGLKSPEVPEVGLDVFIGIR